MRAIGLNGQGTHDRPDHTQMARARENVKARNGVRATHSRLGPRDPTATPAPEPLTPRRSSRVFLVDDDASVRRALTRLIRSAGYPVDAFASAREFLDSLPQPDSPACLVLDVRMPGFSGLDLQSQLAGTNRVLPIIFLTGHGDIPMSVKAMKAGAVDFLSKPVKDTDLLHAIEQALDRATREADVFAEAEDVRQRLDMLTAREREVFEHVISGQLNKQIAYDLGTVEKTIKVHRARVMQKMGVRSLAELVRLADKLGLPAKKQ